MKKYRVKRLYDENGNHIGFSRPRRVIGESSLRADEEWMHSDEKSEYLKVYMVDGKYQIVEDEDLKASDISKKQTRTDAKEFLSNLNLSDLNTVTKLSPVVLKLVRLVEKLI